MHRDHVANIKAELTLKIAEDPNLPQRSCPGRSYNISALEIPGSDWVADFSSQVKATCSPQAIRFD